MGHNSADQFFSRSHRAHSRAGEMSDGPSRARMPSSMGYLLIAVILAMAVFFVLWWMLVSGGDEAPWLPAGLAASVVLLVALSAREVVMRRAWTRYLLENGIHDRSKSRSSSSQHSRSQKKGFSASLYSAALRAIQKQSSAADSSNSTPEAHFEVAQLCHDYLASTEEAMRSGSPGSEKRIAMRASQDRVRELHKHHLLTWARGHSQTLTREAQQKARTSDKIETANKALECLDSTLRVYPDESELHESKAAILELVALVKVAHWVELAERSAFKGHNRRAIDRYRDALFYLNQQGVKDDVRVGGTERIEREIEKLRSRIHSDGLQRQKSEDDENSRRR